MKTILLTATYLVGIGELALAIYFWVTHSKSEIRKVMALFSLSTSIWAITNGLTAYVNASSWVDLNLRVLFVAALIIVTSLVHFSIVFPYKTFNFDKLSAWLLYFSAILPSCIIIFSNTIIASFDVGVSNPGYIKPGPLYLHYEILISLLYCISLGILIYKIKKTDGIHRRNTKLFLSGIILAGLPAVALNLWFAFFGSYFNPLVTVLFSMFWIGFTAYITMRK